MMVTIHQNLYWVLNIFWSVFAIAMLWLLHRLYVSWLRENTFYKLEKLLSKAPAAEASYIYKCERLVLNTDPVEIVKDLFAYSAFPFKNANAERLTLRYALQASPAAILYYVRNKK